jgi:hypothetical protein
MRCANFLYVFQGGPKTGRTRRRLGAHPPLPLALPLRAGRQPVGQARRTRNPRAAETSDGHRGMGARSGVDGCAGWVSASGGGLWLRDGLESRSVGGWLGWNVHPARRRPRTSRAEPPAVAKVVLPSGAPPSPPPAAPLPVGWDDGERDGQAKLYFTLLILAFPAKLG